MPLNPAQLTWTVNYELAGDFTVGAGKRQLLEIGWGVPSAAYFIPDRSLRQHDAINRKAMAVSGDMMNQRAERLHPR